MILVWEGKKKEKNTWVTPRCKITLFGFQQPVAFDICLKPRL